jgi:hypothetical protein
MWKKYHRAGQATDDNTAPAHCMLDPRAKKPQTGCVLLLLSHCNNGCTNAPQWYVIRILSVSLDWRISVFTAQYGLNVCVNHISFRL